ncbi:MAG: excinuclease ABC subunit UvrA [Verrucomicrobiia bacterium]
MLFNTGNIKYDKDAIVVYGAREHNLKNINVTIPRGRFVVITGISGSGKSTLAFDILFSEGQRRYLDSISAYARQFVEQLPRPDVDLIIGLPPTVSIEQRISRGGGKSTVATVTEIYHFLRLLFAKIGTQFCPECNVPVRTQSFEQIISQLEDEIKSKEQITLLAPVIKGRKGFHSEIAIWARDHNFSTIRADGKYYNTDEPFRLDRYKEHNIEIVTGKISKQGRTGEKVRFSSKERELVKLTLEIGSGVLFTIDKKQSLSVYSTQRSCPICGKSFEPVDPKIFSYNSPSGWCPRCRGFGEIFYLPDVDRGSRADAIEESWFEWMEGEREICPDCNGARINKTARSVRLMLNEVERLPRLHTFHKYIYPSIDDFAKATVKQTLNFFEKFKPQGRAKIISQDIIPEILSRLEFLNRVGLDYLQLGRAITTLSGGEAQRIRLAAQLGSNLCGVLYVLDEPTIGLHPRDNQRLLKTLCELRDRGNSIVVVEHDVATMRKADYIIDLGPGAGVYGGRVVATGTLRELLKSKDSVTAKSLKAKNRYPSRGTRRPVVFTSNKGCLNKIPEQWLTLAGARLHNLKNLTVNFPLGRFIVVTGVSGSGKSTLIHDCLLPAIKSKLDNNIPPYGMTLDGHEYIKAVYEIDQSPIGRTPRSIPATYIGFFDEIRRLFSIVPEARLRGYKPGRFSFNSPQGRCPDCNGMGIVKMEMSFIPPAYVKCSKCNGLRFNPETLEIKYNGKNIAEVLEMSVTEALEFFNAIPSIRRPLQALKETGLDYLKLGQASPSLSGGEAQRIKLVAHLLTGFSDYDAPQNINPNASAKKTKVFILEEPTIGLHNADVIKLIEVIQKLVDSGNTVIVIEHNLELIAEADWIIDLGPEGGENGGNIIAVGTPEEVAKNEYSYTGKYLKHILRK